MHNELQKTGILPVFALFGFVCQKIPPAHILPLIYTLFQQSAPNADRTGRSLGSLQSKRRAGAETSRTRGRIKHSNKSTQFL